MKWVLVICISKEAHSKSPKSCYPWGHINSPTDPLGPTHSYICSCQWDVNIPCPLYDLVKETELLKSSHPALPWKSESCGAVPGAAISCAGGWMMWARWWHWHWGVHCCPEECGVLCCFGKWWQVSCCHYSVVTSLVMLSCWAGCVLDMQVLLAAGTCPNPKILLLLLEGTGEVVWQLMCWECGKQ